MPRNRMVRPEFWVSEKLVSCSRDSRLLFIGLWCSCDDAGVHPASYIRLKMEVFPGDNCTIDDIKRWIGELIDHNLIREYAVRDEIYWIVLGWNDLQKIDKPTYRYPLPESDFKQINNLTIPSRGVVDNSASMSREVADLATATQPPLDTKRREEKGKEDKDICEVKTSPSDVSEKDPSGDILEIFTYWQHRMKHARAKLDNKRRSKIVQALKLGYSASELKQAIDGCAKTPYNMGDNERHQCYDDIELIMRDAPHIERFISHQSNPPSSTPVNGGANDLMVGVI